jgi:hypothetical protein
MEKKVKKNKQIKPTQSLVHISIERYGGEFYMGTVARASYDFFKKNRININYFVDTLGSEIWDFIPSEHHILPSNMPFECDDLGHISGASMDDDNHVTVYDKDWRKIWESDLYPENLKELGVQIHCDIGTQLDDLDEGTVVFWGMDGAKGTFFKSEIILEKPFDPKKLKLYYSNLNGYLVSQSTVEYDGKELNGEGSSSTSGTGAFYRFLIAGDEDVYDHRDKKLTVSKKKPKKVI